METQRVAIYTRVSCEEQLKGYGLKIQEEKLRDYCKLHDLDLNEENIFREEGVSGAEKSRPALDKMLDCARRREIDLVLVYRTDRFSRLLKDLLFLVNELEENNVCFKSITEPFDTANPMGKCMFQMIGSFAELEREVIKERMVGGQIKARKEGKWTTPAPYGYNLNKKLHRLEINRDEAKIVKKMYKWIVEERLTLYAIQARLNTLAIPTKYDNLGKKKKVNGKFFWKKRTIGRILTNDVYAGEFTYSKYYHSYHKKQIKGVENGQLRPEADWIVAKTPKIISKQTFNLAREQLDKNRSFSGRNKKKEYLFSGLLECGLCGGKYGAHYESQRTHVSESHRKRYFCNNSRLYIRQERCKTPSITESRIEDPIWDKIVSVLLNPKLAFEQLEKIQKRRINEEGVEDKIKELKTLVEKKRTGMSKLLDLYINGGLDKVSYENKSKKIEEEIRTYSNELERHKNQIVSEKEKELRINSIQAIYKRFKDNLSNINYGEKREVLKMLINKAVIQGNNINVHCNIPYKHAFAGQDMKT